MYRGCHNAAVVTAGWQGIERHFRQPLRFIGIAIVNRHLGAQRIKFTAQCCIDLAAAGLFKTRQQTVDFGEAMLTLHQPRLQQYQHWIFQHHLPRQCFQEFSSSGNSL